MKKIIALLLIVTLASGCDELQYPNSKCEIDYKNRDEKDYIVYI